ncbi:uncharacterized protein LOC126326242 [Schistocerca gregaria]|uniref:uncharacterized protein LOC126326242 n=1 Tax=Schistocerca gregaria TaxID=7010 RepID=UPI00211E03FD|nr:uncharacterized protein LOC126326242 [Schistocerca gregaria]
MKPSNNLFVVLIQSKIPFDFHLINHAVDWCLKRNISFNRIASREFALELVVEEALSRNCREDLVMHMRSIPYADSVTVSCLEFCPVDSGTTSAFLSMSGMDQGSLIVALSPILDVIVSFPERDPNFNLELLEISSCPSKNNGHGDSTIASDPHNTYVKFQFRTSITAILTKLEEAITKIKKAYPYIKLVFWKNTMLFTQIPRTILYYSDKLRSSNLESKTLYQGLHKDILYHCNCKSVLQLFTKFAKIFEYRLVSFIENPESTSIPNLQTYFKTLRPQQLEHTIVLYIDHPSGPKIRFGSEWQPNIPFTFDDALNLNKESHVIEFFNLLGHTFRDLTEIGCLEKPMLNYTAKKLKVTRDYTRSISLVQHWLNYYIDCYPSPCRIESATLVSSISNVFWISHSKKNTTKSQSPLLREFLSTNPSVRYFGSDEQEFSDPDSITNFPPSCVLILTIVAKKLQLSHLSDILKELERYCSFDNVSNVLKVRTLGSRSHATCSFDALEITFSSILKKSFLLENLRRLSLPPSVSLNIQKRKLRLSCKQLAIFDMDSTLIQQECIEEIAAEAGVPVEDIKRITEMAMNGEMSFDEALKRRISMFENVCASATLEKVRRNVKFTPGAKAILKLFRQLNIQTAVISGGFKDIVSHVQKLLEIDEGYSNYLDVNKIEDKFTGKLLADKPLINAFAKFKLIHFMKVQEQVTENAVLAVADGANDLFMLSSVGLGIAFMAKPFLKRNTSYNININNLLVVAYLLGITTEDIREILKSDLSILND